MSSFTDTLILSPLRTDPSKWIVRKSFSYDVGKIGSGDIITVPMGFVTDLTSIPRLFWSILPRWEAYGPAAIIHDYLYFSHEKTKDEADLIFYEGMIVLGVKKSTATIMYNSVKFFAASSYKNRDSYIIKTTEETITLNKLDIPPLSHTN